MISNSEDKELARQKVIMGDVTQEEQYTVMLFGILRWDVCNGFPYLTSESWLCTASLYVTK